MYASRAVLPDPPKLKNLPEYGNLLSVRILFLFQDSCRLMKFVSPSFHKPFRCFLTVFVFLAFTSCRPPTPPPGNSVPLPTHANPSSELRLPPDPVSSPTNKLSSPENSEAADPMGDILSADLTVGETTSRLLSLLPTTPVDDKAFLVQIAGNYCPDEEYWRMLPLLLDRSQPEDVRDELIRDVLRRPDNVRLRPLYRLALDSSHPLSNEAREYLFAYLQDVPEKDFGALGKAVEKGERENR